MARFERYIVKGGKKLRLGYTTGSCAAAAAAAATEMLLTGEEVSEVVLETPKGMLLDLDICFIKREQHTVSCAVQKFSGDDPDITDGMYIFATATEKESDISIVGGEGVGVVTKPGLPVEVGKAAINPVPYSMIEQQVKKQLEKHRYNKGVEIKISAPKGAELARKTYNPRLGIKNGISILGTTGIVEPMSNRALIETFKVEMRAAKARGEKAVLIVPGNYGLDYVLKQYGVQEKYAIQCSNFMGEALDYASYLAFEKILIVGHAGKLVKLAAGVMNTHSNTADARMEVIAAHAAMTERLEPEQVKKIMQSITVKDANGYLERWGILNPTWQSIQKKIGYHIDHRISSDIKFGFVVFDETGMLASQGDIKEILMEIGDSK